MHKKLLFLFVFILAIPNVKADFIDSLKKQVIDFPFPESDTSAKFNDLLSADTLELFRISDACGKIGNYYLKNNQYEDAVLFFKRQTMLLKVLNLIFPDRVNYKKELINVFNRAGAASLFINEFEKARKYFLNALDYFFRLNLVQQKNLEVRAGLFNVYVNLGKIYSFIDDFPMALTYNLKALEISDAIKDYYGSIAVCNQIGLLYRIQKRYDSSISWYIRGMKISEILGSQKEPADAYYQLGETFYIKGDFTSAINYFSKSNRIWKAQLERQPDDSVAATRLLNGYMNVIFCMKDTMSDKNIVPFFNETQKILPMVKDNKSLCIYFERKSFLSRLKRDSKNEILNLEKALSYARETKEGSISLSYLFKLFQLYKKINRQTEANYYEINYNSCKDSLAEVQSSLKEKKQEIKASIKKQAMEEKTLIEQIKAEEANENERAGLLQKIGFAFLGILLIIGLFYRYKRKKN